MGKTATAKKIDFIFISVVLYVIFFIMYFYFFRRIIFVTALSLLTILTVLTFYFFITKNKRAKLKLTANEQKHADSVFYNLPYLCDEKRNNFLKNLFEKAGYTVNIEDGIFTVLKDGVKKSVYCCFNGTAEIHHTFECEKNRQQSNSHGFILFCSEINADAQTAVKNLGNDYNKVFNRNSFYSEMKKYHEFPEIIYVEKPNKKKINNLFVYTFRRNRFKSYFILAIIMFLFSFISPLRNYYLIFSGVLFIFCFFTLISGNKNNIIDNKKDLSL